MPEVQNNSLNLASFLKGTIVIVALLVIAFNSLSRKRKKSVYNRPVKKIWGC